MRSLVGFTLVLFVLPLVPQSASAGGPIGEMARPATGAKAATSTAPAAPSQGAAGALRPVPAQLSAGKSVPAVPRTPEQKALEAIREDARVQVQALSARIAGMPDGPARYDLLRQVMEVKQQAEVRCFEAKIAFARERGDLAAARQIETVLDRMLHPIVPAVPPSAQAPGKAGAK